MHSRISRRGTTLGLLAAFFAALLLTLLSSHAAFASAGGDGGTGGAGGTGTCNRVGWDLVYSLGDLVHKGPGTGSDCGSFFDGPYNDNTQQAMTDAKAPGCYDNRSDLLALWYVVDSRGSWATNAGSDNAPMSYNAAAAQIDADLAVGKIKGITTSGVVTATLPSGQQWKYNPTYVASTAKAHLLQNPSKANGKNSIVCVWADSKVPSCSQSDCGGDYTCSDDPNWGSFLPSTSPARNAASTMPGYEAAENYCFSRCPSASQDHTGLKIPNSYASQPGDYCWHGSYGDGQWQTSQTNSDTVTEPYAWSTTAFDANDPNGTSPLAAGQDAFKPVTSDPVISPYGKFYNAHCTVATGCDVTGASNESGEYAAFLKALKDAVAADATVSHATVSLDDAHKAAFAQGRVVTFREMTTYATVALKAWVTKWYTRTCTYHYNLDGSVVSTSCTAWTYTPSQNADKHTWDNSQAVATSMPRATQAWQALTSHCNATDFNAVTNAGTADLKANGTDGLIDSLDSSHYYSASAVSKVYTNVSQLPWGGMTGNETSKARFFDRLCYYAGKEVDPTSGKAQTKSPLADWSFFRDGELHTLQGTDGQSPYFVPNVAGDTRKNDVPDPGPAPAVVADPGPAPTAVAAPGAAPVAPTPVAAPGADTGTVTDTRTYSWTACGGTGATVSDVDWGTRVGTSYDDSAQYAYSAVFPSGINCAKTTSHSWSVGLPAHTQVYWTLWSSNLSKRGSGSFVTAHSSAWNNANNAYQAYVSAHAAYVTAANAWQAKNTAYQNYLKAVANWNVAKQNYQAYLTAKAAWDQEKAAYDNPGTHSVSVVDNASATQPVATILTRDPQGTPGSDWMNIVGVGVTGTSSDAFSRNASDVATPEAQTQFLALQAFSSSVSSILPGSYKQLATRSAWASDKGKPQTLTLAWYFDPMVSNRAPVTDAGFGGKGGAVTWTAGTITTDVVGRVEASNSSLTMPSGESLTAAQARVYSNSGTGSTDGLDVPLAYGSNKDASGQWTSEPSKADQHYFSWQFVRATTS